MSHVSVETERRTTRRSRWISRNVWGRICVDVADDPPPNEISDESAQQQGPPPKPRPTKVVKGI
jgi:hypothetical protein